MLAFRKKIIKQTKKRSKHTKGKKEKAFYLKENKILPIFLTGVFILATDWRSRYTKTMKEKVNNTYLISFGVFLDDEYVYKKTSKR